MILDLIAAASDSDAPWLLLLAGPIGGAGTYWMIYRYYRNTDKSHAYERDTIIEAEPVRGGEQQTGHISKTRKSGIAGDNSRNHRQRVRRTH